jgi:Arc/MetJ family transcription regulator
MRTTITLDQDVAAAVMRIRGERSIGLSEVVNELVRAGLSAKRPLSKFQQRTKALGLRVDPTNVAEALELLEGPTAR